MEKARSGRDMRALRRAKLRCARTRLEFFPVASRLFPRTGGVIIKHRYQNTEPNNEKFNAAAFRRVCSSANFFMAAAAGLALL
jgi:hypothetical protein